jgi:preprotein translocase subunit SecE
MTIAKPKEKAKREGDTMRPTRSETGGSSGSRSPEREHRENGLVRTFREIRSEMKKVVWPTREETTRLTIVVILVSLIISLLLAASDFIFTYLLTLLQGAVAR